MIPINDVEADARHDARRRYGWNGQRGQLGERRGQGASARPGVLYAEPAVTTAGQACGDVQKPVVQRLRLGLRQLAVQEHVLGR